MLADLLKLDIENYKDGIYTVEESISGRYFVVAIKSGSTVVSLNKMRERDDAMTIAREEVIGNAFTPPKLNPA
ncbi:unnamed protein product, partial [marine sediment metagenome]